MVVDTFAALADSSRLRIFDSLRAGPRPVNEISHRLDLRQPQVSKHLRILREAGLVTVEARAQQRLYELRPERLRELQAWLERYRMVWEARFDSLDEVLLDLQADKEKAHGRKRRR